MEKEAKIIGTREGCYLACVDDEKALLECDEECPVCPRECRVLLDKEQPLESGRRVLADIKVPLFLDPRRFYLILAGVFLCVFVVLLLVKKTLLPYYRSSLPTFMGGFFGAAIFYLLVKIHHDKTKGKKNLRKGKIIRAYPPDR